MKARFAAIFGVLFLTVGCAASPPVPAPAREETVVAVSFAATWDATIDHFAEDNIPISTIERASGIVATTRLGVDPETALIASDCGTGQGIYYDVRFRATDAIYNVLVRGDERSSTVRVTVSWSNPAASFECTTTGVWEAETQEAIKERAEGGK